MATNQQVAARLCSTITKHLTDASQPLPAVRPLTGSNLRAENDAYRYKVIRTNSGGLFTHLSQAVSYSTEIAEVVWNSYAKVPELWLRPRTYSPTTSRHMSYIRQAFIEKMVAENFAFDTAAAHDHIYYTDCISTNHCRVTHAMQDYKINPYTDYPTMASVRRQLKDVDKPRLRETTRRSLLTAAFSNTLTINNLMARDVPVEYELMHRKPIIMSIVETSLFIDALCKIPNTKDLRLAVRGWAELEKESHNG